MFNSLQLTGRVADHVRESAELGCTLHPEAAEALLAMRSAARADGIQLAVVSAFRDFKRQIAIWDGKFSGARTVFDRHGQAVDWPGLADSAKVHAILQWSALPGASRHHWGTDFDVIDCAAVGQDYRPQLTADEFDARGVFAKLSSWLQTQASQFGFFRPYDRDRGGVLPEPWHLSYAALSVPALEAFTLELLTDTVRGSDLEGKACVLEMLPEIYERYVKNLAP
ncbi:MAG TPA: M15 family metallopeptidase [Steroidobacteraceae bacterium]|jgi:LAS superfamily LD-carboxypeptidase LdcB